MLLSDCLLLEIISSKLLLVSSLLRLDDTGLSLILYLLETLVEISLDMNNKVSSNVVLFNN